MNLSNLQICHMKTIVDFQTFTLYWIFPIRKFDTQKFSEHQFNRKWNFAEIN